MKKLSQLHYNHARQFIAQDARKLEQAIFMFEFESGSYGDVLKELSAFQNEDGGFGHGLEPDLRCKESSALATTKALEVLQLSNESSSEKNLMIARALRFLKNTFRDDLFGWDIIPKVAEQSPRAIWWNYGVFSEHWGNPNADIIRFFIDYEAIFKLNQLEELTTYAINHLNENCDLKEMHELFCYLHLYERLNTNRQQAIKDQLQIFMENCVEKNSFQENNYTATPLDVAPSPKAAFYQNYADVIPDELDDLIDSQTSEGVWEPNWEWGQFAEEWQIAKREWAGILTLKALRVLRNYDRMEVKLR